MTSNGDSVGVRMRRLCEASVRSTSVDGGSVALVSAPASRVVLSATDTLAVALEEAQMGLGEGPYVDAETALSPVLVSDLADPRVGDGRWPVFAREAHALDVSALFAFPIRVSTVSVGTFGLYRQRPGVLSTTHLGVALDAVEEIAQLLLDHRTWAEFGDNGTSHPDGSGKIGTNGAFVHQAAGMVMVQMDVTIDEALALLRATAFAEGTSLGELAVAVVDRRRRLGKGSVHD
jgi:hypothetical protein